METDVQSSPKADTSELPNPPVVNLPPPTTTTISQLPPNLPKLPNTDTSATSDEDEPP